MFVFVFCVREADESDDYEREKAKYEEKLSKLATSSVRVAEAEADREELAAQTHDYNKHIRLVATTHTAQLILRKCLHSCVSSLVPVCACMCCVFD